jgi:hypothetical protein
MQSLPHKRQAFFYEKLSRPAKKALKKSKKCIVFEMPIVIDFFPKVVLNHF